MTCFAVVDTNVLVAALLSDKKDSATVQVVGSLLTGEIIPVYSKEIVAEYREVLHRKKFGFSEDTVEYLLDYDLSTGGEINDLTIVLASVKYAMVWSPI